MLTAVLGAALAVAAPSSPVEIRLVEIKGLSLSRGGASVTARLEATRRVGTPLRLRGVDATLMLNRVELASVQTDARVRLRRDQPALLDLPVQIDPAAAVTGALGALGSRALDLHLKGEVRLTAWWVLRRRVPIQVRLSP